MGTKYQPVLQSGTHKMCWNPNEMAVFGESGNFGDIPIAGSGNVSTNEYYNNYNISLHNEIWSSAFSGNMAIGLSWFYQIIHKWPMGNPEPIDFPGTANELGDVFTLLDIGFNPITSGIIESSYNNYSPLKDFIATSGIDFNENYEPDNYINAADNLECYYLKNADHNTVYGWIHNRSTYWYNQYYYAQNIAGIPYYNWVNNTIPNVSTGIKLTGLVYDPQNPTTYSLTFYKTSAGTSPPDFPGLTYTLTTNSNGEVYISSAELGTFLGFDAMHADIAFSLVKDGQRGFNGQINAENNKRNIPFSIYPNPNNGIFSVVFNASDTINKFPFKLQLFDPQGRLLKEDLLMSLIKTYQFTSFSKGCYFLRVSNKQNIYFSKIIFQ